MDSTYVARCVQLAMLLEVSATPKPGNVDREHDYADMKYEHFLASAAAVYPIFENAAKAGKNVGKHIKDAVAETQKWQHGGNTHFGTFLLMMPLAMASGASDEYKDIRKNAVLVVKNTTVADAINLYKALRIAKVKVRPVKEFDVYSGSSLDEIRRKKTTLYDLMKISSGRDLIARDWINSFEQTFRFASEIKKRAKITGINEAIVRSYLALLSEQIDTFVETKFGVDVAKDVKSAATALRNADLADVKKWGTELISRKINPGSSADIMAGAIFLALIGGLRF
jgi:triphosphoribosyl-dephospho-CoA synthase